MVSTLEVEQLEWDQVTTDFRLELQGKSKHIKKLTEIMSSMVDKIEGLQVKMPDWAMEDMLEPVSLPTTVLMSSFGPEFYDRIIPHSRLRPSVNFSGPL